MVRAASLLRTFALPAIPFRSAEIGFPLTRDDANHSYAIIRHNIRTYRSDGVVEVVRGKQSAETAVKKWESSQDSADHHAGWRYFYESIDLKAGTDPAEATRHRQVKLESRESKALEESDPARPSPNFRNKF